MQNIFGTHGRVGGNGRYESAGGGMSDEDMNLSMPQPIEFNLSDILPPNHHLVAVPDHPIKKKRGRTTMRNTVAKLGEGEHFQISLNEDDKPVKGKVNLMSTYVGIEARHIPCTYDSWVDVPLSIKEGLYYNVKEKFSFGGGECFYKVNKIANDAWRHSKMKTRESVLEAETLRDALKLIPDGCDEGEWARTCIRWRSAEYETMCEKKRGAREKVKLKHGCGPYSFDYVAVNSKEQGESLFNKMFKTKTSGMSAGAQAMVDGINLEMKALPLTMAEDERVKARKEAFERLVSECKKKRIRRTRNEDCRDVDRDNVLKTMESKWEEDRQILLAQVEAQQKAIEAKEKAMEAKDKANEAYRQKVEERFAFLERSLSGMGCYIPQFAPTSSLDVHAQDDDETQPLDFDDHINN